MYYKLLNKNLITAALVSAIALGAAGTCDAQGIVSLAEDEDISLPRNDTDSNNVAPEADLTLDTELPNVLPEDDDIIPLDSEGMISPTPAGIGTNKATPENKPQAEAVPAGEESSAASADEAFDEDTDFNLGLEENMPEETALPAPAAETAPILPGAAPAAADTAPSPLLAPKESAPVKKADNFANSILDKVDNDLFMQMSDIEKQTTLLTLELRRERIRSEIEAIKAQRKQAEQEKIAAEEEKKRKEFEWKKEQEAKVLREQQILKEKEIELEKLKQKKVLNAYMNRMLEQNQKWIKDNAEIYQQMREVEADRKSLVQNFKKKLEELSALANKTLQNANNAKSNHDRTLASLTAQNIQLKKRIEADAIAAKNRQQNPFAAENANNKNAAPVATSIDSKIVPINIAKEYAIMDITGKGNNLVAKLINKEGDSFLARKGTVLQTGHAVEEITPTYIQFDRNGLKDYLYTTGSAMSMEPDKLEGTGDEKSKPKKKPVVEKPKTSGLSVDSGIPSLGTGMFVK